MIVGEYKGGTGPRSRAGDTLKMKCYVNSTFPSANVTWFVNGKMVRDISALRNKSTYANSIVCDAVVPIIVLLKKMANSLNKLSTAGRLLAVATIRPSKSESVCRRQTFPK